MKNKDVIKNLKEEISTLRDLESEKSVAIIESRRVAESYKELYLSEVERGKRAKRLIDMQLYPFRLARWAIRRVSAQIEEVSFSALCVALIVLLLSASWVIAR